MISDNSKMNSFVEIPVTLKLRYNVAEVARMLAICYYQDVNHEIDGDAVGSLRQVFDNFISGEVTKIIYSLAENPPEPPYFPDSFKQHLKDILFKSDEEGEGEGEEV